MSTPDVGTSHPVSAAVALSPAGWTWALLAIAAPTLIAAHDPPSVTFYNQALAVLGWGLWLAWMGRAPGGLDTPASPRAQAKFASARRSCACGSSTCAAPLAITGKRSP